MVFGLFKMPTSRQPLPFEVSRQRFRRRRFSGSEYPLQMDNAIHSRIVSNRRAKGAKTPLRLSICIKLSTPPNVYYVPRLSAHPRHNPKQRNIQEHYPQQTKDTPPIRVSEFSSSIRNLQLQPNHNPLPQTRHTNFVAPQTSNPTHHQKFIFLHGRPKNHEQTKSTRSTSRTHRNP